MSKKKNNKAPAAPARQTAASAGTATGANHSAREKNIRDYFTMWLTHDGDRIAEIFTEDAVYVECTGSEYHGSHQIESWFADWFRNGVVKRWDINAFSHAGSKTFVEWHFECVCYDRPSAFDGVSVVEFDGSGKVCALREFSAEYLHTTPYAD